MNLPVRRLYAGWTESPEMHDVHFYSDDRRVIRRASRVLGRRFRVLRDTSKRLYEIRIDVVDDQTKRKIEAWL